MTEHRAQLRRRAAARPVGAERPAATGRRRRRPAAPRRAPDGAGRGVHLLLRPAGGQGLAVGGRHPGLPVPGRTGGGLVPAGRRRRPDRPSGAAAGRPDLRTRRDQRQLRRPGARPGPAVPVRQHAAGRQAHLADVGRHLDPHRVRAAGRAGRRRRAAGAGWRTGCPARCGRRSGCSAGWPGLRVSAPRWSRPRWPPTPRRCWPTPRRRPGARPASSCRSSSSARRRRPRAGLGMLLAPVSEAGPARRLALGGALLELGAERADGSVDGRHRRAAAHRAPAAG